MKRYVLATLSALSLLSAPLAVALAQPQQDPYAPGRQGEVQEGVEHEHMGAATSKHVLMGQVTELDAESNEVTIRTSDGKELELSFPASELANIKEGDRVSLELSLKPAAAGTEEQPSGIQPEQQPE